MQKLTMRKFLLILSLFLSIFTEAQITNSSISGKIKEVGGSGVISTVKLVYTPTGYSYTVLTDSNGVYRIYNLNPGGPYTININSVGYKPYLRENLYLSLGENDGSDHFLEKSFSELKEVVVTGTRERVKNGISLSEDRMRGIPTLSRSITDFTKLVPQNINNSFLGTNFRYNNVTIDGAINNDAIGFSPSLGGQSGTSGMPGSSTRTSSISLDAIQDIQVYLTPYDVKIGNFLGGSINAVTRSGTNKTKGSVYIFGRNSVLTGFESGRDYLDYQAGARVGFPIVKNKVFFFTSGEITKRNEPVFYGSNSNGLINDSVANLIRNFTLNKYGYDVGEFQNYNINSESYKFFNRIDWKINDKNQLTVRNNTVFSNATNLERDASNFRFSSMDFKQNNNQFSTVAELRSRIGKVSNSLVLGHTHIHDFRTPLSQDPAFPQTEISYNGGTIFIGNEREATIFNLKQRTIEITDNLNFSKGIHSFTVGTHNEIYRIDYGFVNSWNGRISYKSLNDYFAGKVNRVRGFYGFNNNEREYLFSNPYAKFNVNLLSLYAQDDISFNKFKLSAGVRLDYTGLPNKPSLNKTLTETHEDSNTGTTYSNTPFGEITNSYFDNINVSPRVGFNWDVKGDKSITIRGGSGIFVGRIPFAWLGYAYYNDGVGFGSYDLNNRASVSNIGDPIKDGSKNFAFNNGQRNLVQVDLIDNGFRMPKTWRSNLALDLNLKGYKFTLEGIYTEILRDLMFQQINIKDSVKYYNFDVNREMPVYYGNKINPAFSNVYLLSNTNKGYGYNITASVSKRYKFGLDFYTAYTYGKSFDITNGIRNSMESNWQLNQSLTPNDPKLAYSNFDVRHRIVSNINYKYKNSQISFLFNSRSGTPFSWGIINTSLSNTPQAVSLAYIFKDLNQASAYIPNQAQAIEFIEFVNGDPYLKSRMGGFTERNGGRTPWSTTVDMKIAQNIKIKKGEFQITLDVFNLTNLLNSKWGNMYFVPNTFNSTSSVGLNRINSGTSEPVFSFSTPGKPYVVDNINSRWQAQMGIRYSF